MNCVFSSVIDDVVYREKSVIAEEPMYDLIICGLGSAGAAASSAAGRYGLRVLALERFTCMGGTGTGGAVIGYYYGSHGGLWETLEEQNRVSAVHKQPVYTESGYSKNAEEKKNVLEQECRRSKIDLRYDASVTGVYLVGKKIIGIQWIEPDGLKSARCGAVIDATGDAAVCALAGCKMLPLGRSFDGITQPVSSVRVHLNSEGEVVHRYRDDWIMDGRCSDEITETIIRSYSHHLSDIHSEDTPLLYLAPELGVRETRTIKGEKVLNWKDFINGNNGNNVIFYGYGNLDNHAQDRAFESEEQQDWSVAAGLFGINFSFPVPMEVLIPEGWDGILAAGRCLSAEHDIASAARQQRDMQKSGEAAAAMVYLASRNETKIMDIPYHELSTLLEQSGCLMAENDEGFKEIYSHIEMLNIPFIWYTDKNRIKSELASSKPGIAMWSANLLGSKIEKDLIIWMQKADKERKITSVKQLDYLAKHAAFALALSGKNIAAPVLREIVEEGDACECESSRRGNEKHSLVALYLLGKLADTDSLPLLLSIFRDTEKYIKKVLRWEQSLKSELYGSHPKWEKMVFQYFTHSYRALIRLAEKNKDLRTEIATEIYNKLETEKFKLINHLAVVTDKGQDNIPFPLTNTLRIATAFIMDRWGIAHGLWQTIKEESLSSREKRLVQKWNTV